MGAFTYAPKTEPKPNAEPKTCTSLILFFSVSVAEFQQTLQVILIKSAHTQPRALYIILVIMKTIDGLSSETIVQLFYKLNTGYYRLLWDNTQSDCKDHELNAVIWSNLYCKGISAI